MVGSFIIMRFSPVQNEGVVWRLPPPTYMQARELEPFLLALAYVSLCCSGNYVGAEALMVAITVTAALSPVRAQRSGELGGCKPKVKLSFRFDGAMYHEHAFLWPCYHYLRDCPNHSMMKTTVYEPYACSGLLKSRYLKASQSPSGCLDCVCKARHRVEGSNGEQSCEDCGR